MNAITRILSVVLLGLAGPGAALAQAGPAEYPPATFKGSQYVDSKGCVFVRAGVDGATQWVPRMARNRTAVCGFKPTQVAGATSGPAPVDRSGVTVITAAVPEAGGSTAATVRTPTVRTATTTRVAPRPTPSVRAAAPTAAPVVIRPAQPVVTGPSVRTVRAAPPVYSAPAAPVVEARPRIVAPSVAPQVAAPTARACGNLSATGQQYMGFGGAAGVRCGPQADYAPYAPGAAQPAPRFAGAPGYATPDYRGTTAVPNYDARVPQAPVAAGPRVFEVPRTNVQRVVRARTTTQAQIAPTARVLPRPAYEERVLSQGVQVPQGYRPIWEDDRLNPRRGEQTLQGMAQSNQVWTQTTPRRLVPVQIAPQAAAPQGYRVPNYDTPRTTVSSRNVAPQRVASAGSYIQVGSYRTPANAQSVAQRLSANGLPVRMRNSGTAQMVMIGPFGNDRDLGNALNIARRAGFHDAFPRR
ncbi:SPOR domain-containing protein [Pseudooceanicola sp. MF1-13]|uniref:SPOR domain-containing protein n=1 Tax=Pseudooceanicola sp. MF1-13 TaxID=3379095 RepID=UPI00389295F7